MKTDWVVLAMLLYYGFSGWGKGLIRSLLGPIALLLGLWLGIGYFYKTHNFFVSAVISLVGPVVFKIITFVLLRLFQSDIPGKPSTLSLFNRGLGAAFNLFWGGAMVAIMILLFAFAPMEYIGLGNVKADIVHSRSFAFIFGVVKPYLPKQHADTSEERADVSSKAYSQVSRVFLDPRVQALLADPDAMRLVREGDKTRLAQNAKYQAIAKDPKLLNQMEQLSSQGGFSSLENNKDYQELIEDQRVQDLVTDPEILRLIQEKKFVQIMGNPKLQKVLQDPVLLKKFLNLQQHLGGMTSTPSVSSQPTGSGGTP